MSATNKLRILFICNWLWNSAYDRRYQVWIRKQHCSNNTEIKKQIKIKVKGKGKRDRDQKVLSSASESGSKSLGKSRQTIENWKKKAVRRYIRLLNAQERKWAHCHNTRKQWREKKKKDHDAACCTEHEESLMFSFFLFCFKPVVIRECTVSVLSISRSLIFHAHL